MEDHVSEIMKYVDAHKDEIHSDEDVERLIEEFCAMKGIRPEEQFEMDDSPETAEDWLEMAENTRNEKKALEYAQKALALEPDNLDAARMVAERSTKAPEEYLEKLEELIEKGEKQLKASGHFEESMGDFWLDWETRPYMRVRYEYMKTLCDCGMYRKAIAEGEEMMRLCTNDNLGVRFTLAFLYAALEEEAPLLALRDSQEYNEENSEFLLALALMYYKRHELDTARTYIEKLCKVNKDTKRFFTKYLKDGGMQEMLREASPYGYELDTIEELVHTFLSNETILLPAVSFVEWAHRSLKVKRNSTTAKKTK